MSTPAVKIKQKSIPAIDPWLSHAFIALISIGIVMVYSSSIDTAGTSAATHYQEKYYLIRQLAFLALGLTIGTIVFATPSDIWKRMALPLFGIGVLLLALVLVPGLGKVVNGARRWISVAGFGIQPSELMKVFTILYAADYTARKLKLMHDLLRGFMPMAFVVSIVGCLLLMQPDFGSFVVICAIAFGILFLGGVNMKIFTMLFIVVSILFSALIWFSPYRRDRLVGFLDPWQDPLGKGYQLSHSLIAFGRGGFWGQGLGNSVEKLNYLPEAHTDFIMAVIAEETGMIGVSFLIFLFTTIIFRSFAVARRAESLGLIFQSLVARGFGVWMTTQAFFNMGVNMGVLPTKGLTLPFLSFGGSGLLANCIGMALLLRIDYENRKLSRESGVAGLIRPKSGGVVLNKRKKSKRALESMEELQRTESLGT